MRQHAALRRADEEILQVNRQLEQSSRYKSEFLANMSHELRTPLNAIMGFSEILLDVTMNLTAGERTEFLRNIHSSGQHLLGLINDILDLAKIEAGKMDLHPEEMPVMAALQEITAILDPMARQQGLQLRTVGAADAFPVLRVQEVGPGAYYVLGPRVHGRECGDDDLEAPRGLRIRIRRRVDAVGKDGGRSRDKDVAAVAHRP